MRVLLGENQVSGFQKSVFENNFEEFIEAFGKQILGISRRLCGWDEAEDTMQETFMAVYQHLPRKQFENDKAFRGWVFRIAKNTCLMQKRQGKHAPKQMLSIDAWSENPELKKRESIEIPDYSIQPDRELLRVELNSVIKKALSILPDNHRRVFFLREIEGKSTRETAEILRISEQNVKVRLHRAKSVLQKQLRIFYFG